MGVRIYVKREFETKSTITAEPMDIFFEILTTARPKISLHRQDLHRKEF